MKPKLLIAFSLCFTLFLLINNSVKAQSHCCPLPDSLSVTSLTDSSFCVKWKVKDSIACDTPYGAILLYRPVNTANWATRKIKYDSVTKYYSWCDTLTACVKYQWKLRNVCIRNGDTTYTEYVKGPNFTAHCDTSGFAKNVYNNSKVQIFPNPVRSTITLKGTFAAASKVKVVIADLQGTTKLQREVSLVNGILQVSFDASTWNKGAYFITISDGKKMVKQNFIKE